MNAPSVVVDASAILSLAFEDEDRACGFRILDAAEAGRNLIVPAVWPLELGNGLIVAERKGRLKPEDLAKFSSLLKGLAVAVDQRSFAYTMETILPLSRKYNLTVYDAAYLELAIREGATLASIDGRLCEACKAAGGTIRQYSHRPSARCRTDRASSGFTVAIISLPERESFSPSTA